MDYDAKILEGYARRLYTMATVFLVVCTLIGAAAGGFIGYLPVILWYRRGSSSPPPTDAFTLPALLLGALFGAIVGRIKGFDYKLRAQLVLCQMQIEQNTRPSSSIQR